ncbi:MAG: hypothetical protein HRT54_04125 [Colwellia sp.]|nr:hypothetical protein [Colwellia sp.]
MNDERTGLCRDAMDGNERRTYGVYVVMPWMAMNDERTGFIYSQLIYANKKLTTIKII